MAENNVPPRPKRKPYKPMYDKKIYEKYKDACEGLTGSKLDGCVSSILEGSPSMFELPRGGVDVAKGGVIKKKANKKPKMMHGGMHKKAKMMGGGMYQKKTHSYATGGTVKDMNIMKSK